MYLRVLVALLAARAGADDLVAVIKHDLQTNNDDYADLRRAGSLASPPPSTPLSSSTTPPPSTPLSSSTTPPPPPNSSFAIPPPSPDNVGEQVPEFFVPLNKPHFKIPLPALFRRSSRTKSDDETSKTTLEVTKVASWYTGFGTERSRNKKIDRIPTKSSAAVKTLTTTKPPSLKSRDSTAEPQKPRQAFSPRPNDLAFHKRNPSGKGMGKSFGTDNANYKELDDFLKLNSKMKSRVTKAGNALKKPKPMMRATWKVRQRGRGKRRHRPRMRSQRNKGVRGPVNAKLPDAEVLDMAPARGARVFSKRLQHRLCSRSMLNPEGPKYNSAGKIYLNHFVPRGRGNFQFNQTRAPRLLLPRCCNCCRKSVLGCE